MQAPTHSCPDNGLKAGTFRGLADLNYWLYSPYEGASQSIHSVNFIQGEGFVNEVLLS